MTLPDALAELRSIGCPAYVWRGNPARGHVDRLHYVTGSTGVRGGCVEDWAVWAAVARWVRSRRRARTGPVVRVWKGPEQRNVRWLGGRKSARR